MSIYSGDEDAGDEVMSGPIADLDVEDDDTEEDEDLEEDEESEG